MNPWSTNPVWQNFSSLYREFRGSLDARTDIEKWHHLTASLYFGIAALEAFLNQEMRAHLSGMKTEEEIFNVLRRGRLMSKMKEWPLELLPKPLKLEQKTFELLEYFNDVRGNVTHPKGHGREIYEDLSKVQPMLVIGAIAEYIVRFHEAQGRRYPYWVFGWNYLNPRMDIHEIIIVNDQQFCFSLQALGLDVPAADYANGEAWRDKYLTTFEGYVAISETLASLDRCEPKADRFPYQPILCRRWWTSEHHASCGRVTEASLSYARDYGA